jgi:hypothetical protein
MLPGMHDALNPWKSVPLGRFTAPTGVELSRFCGIAARYNLNTWKIVPLSRFADQF